MRSAHRWVFFKFWSTNRVRAQKVENLDLQAPASSTVRAPGGDGPLLRVCCAHEPVRPQGGVGKPTRGPRTATTRTKWIIESGTYCESSPSSQSATMCDKLVSSRSLNPVRRAHEPVRSQGGVWKPRRGPRTVTTRTKRTFQSGTYSDSSLLSLLAKRSSSQISMSDSSSSSLAISSRLRFFAGAFAGAFPLPL